MPQPLPLHRLSVPVMLALLSLFLGSIVTIGGFSLMRLAAWQGWQIHDYWFFLVTRAIGFSLAAWGWVSFRRRTLRVRPTVLERVKRAEVTAALGILLIELMRIGAIWESLA